MTTPSAASAHRVTRSSSPTRILPPTNPTVLDPYGVSEDSSNSQSATILALPNQRLSSSDARFASKINHRVQADLREQRDILKAVQGLYGQRHPTKIAPPDQSLFGRAVSWLAAKFGVAGAQVRQDLDISSKLKEARNKATEKQNVFTESKEGTKEIQTSILEEAKKVSRKLEGKTFVVDERTPTILKQVSVPEDKEHLAFKKLKSQVLQVAKNSNGRIKLHSPSEERLVLYRQREDKTWESLELSWRGLTKVNIVHNGKLTGNLFNCDAVKLAKRFANFEGVGLKRRDASQDRVRKVISLKDEQS